MYCIVFQPGHIGTEWQYSVDWYEPQGSTVRQDAVVVTSKPRSVAGDSDLVVRMWTTSEAAADIATAHHPLALFVSVEKGGGPVLEANVSVSVTIVTVEMAVVAVPAMRLHDSGNGDPDMMANDGVYSRYLVAYPAEGRYSFAVTVNDNAGRAVVVREARDGRGLPARVTPGVSACCGSAMPVPAELTEKTGPFARTVSGSVVNLFEVPGGKEDRMPPAKIGDLKVKVFPETQSVLATWTAPGDDFDTGSVSGYRFVFSKNVSELVDQTAQPRTLVGFSRSDPAGTATSYQFRFTFFNEDFYLGLVGRDAANNTGKVSNLVNVMMPAQVEAVADHSRTIKDNDDVDIRPEIGDDWLMIGALCGAILILAICLMLGVLYFVKFARPKKPIVVVDVGGRDADRDTDNSSYSSDNTKNTSSHRLMLPPSLTGPPDVATVSGGLSSFTAPPPSLPDSTPTYWSASQLLTEHEQRALDVTYGTHVMGPLHPIREEYIGYPEEYSAYSVTELDFSDVTGNTNYGYRETNGTPRHQAGGRASSLLSGDPDGEALLRTEDRNSAASSSNQSESVISVGSNLFRAMGGGPAGEPVRYSTGVQTLAPSTTAQLFNNSAGGGPGGGTLRTRNVSLV